jgi:hypothetical protein
MDEFRAGKALLAGARLIRRRPVLVMSWAALFLARALVLTAAYQGLLAWVSARSAGGAPVTDLSLPLAGFGLGRTALSLILSAVLFASAFRALLRPPASPYFGFGREELFVLASQVITQLIAGLPVLAVLAAITLVHGLGSVIAGDRWIVIIFQTLGLFWSVVASVWAFDTLEIAPVRCWTIARGRFWLLAGLVPGVLVLRLLAGAGLDGVAAGLSHSLPVAAPFRYVTSAVLEALEIALLAGIVSSAYRTGVPASQAASLSSAASGSLS